MAIYEKPVRLLMKDMVSRLNIREGQIITKQQVLSWFDSNYSKIKSSTISAHLIRMSINATSRVHYQVNPNGDDDLFFQIDGKRFRLYNPQSDPPPIYEKQDDILEYNESDSNLPESLKWAGRSPIGTMILKTRRSLQNERTRNPLSFTS